MKNDLLLRALRCENTARPPVWLMRQAGRYLPEYRKIREKYPFLEMCHTPEIAAEVTLLPITILEVDAAILFSDILVILEVLGFRVRFDEGKGPVIENPLTAKDVLAEGDVEEALSYVAETIRIVLPELSVPLIGFAGAPFTVASYLIEGGTSSRFKKDERVDVQPS